MHETSTPRLNGWDYSSPHAYHVTICTKDKQCLLGYVSQENFESRVILSRVGLEVERAIVDMTGHNDTLSIDAFSIMPNHVHLLLKLNDEARHLSNYVASIKAAATRNAKAAGFKGTLWQRNFWDHIIRGKEDYLATIEYIEANPSKWAEDKLYRAK